MDADEKRLSISGFWSGKLTEIRQFECQNSEPQHVKMTSSQNWLVKPDFEKSVSELWTVANFSAMVAKRVTVTSCVNAPDDPLPTPFPTNQQR